MAFNSNESKEFEFLVEIDEKIKDTNSVKFDYDKENLSENVISLRDNSRPSQPFQYYEN